ncbi:MAG TPA: phosphomethylpyrimidine synthase ThiC, partial [Actinomycetota bacterium]|nr:phosphomethylpyrimidine synthase ThiC [Actinomycetota bacterium]
MAGHAGPNARKVFVQGSRPDLRVPMREIALSPTPSGYGPAGSEENPPIRLYDTGGPYTDAGAQVDIRLGLPPLRRPWILERGDVEEYPGASLGIPVAGFSGPRPTPLRAKPGACVTQLHYARAGTVTPEMEFVAIREGLDPEFVRAEIASGRAILPANVNHPETEPMAIGRNLAVKINANIG